MTTAAATVDYLADLPWFAVSDPDEPTPIFQSVMRDLAAATPCWCGSSGDEPCRTKGGRVLQTPHKGRGQ